MRCALAALLLSTACQTPARGDDPMAWTLGTWCGERRSEGGARIEPMRLRVEALPDGSCLECLQVQGVEREDTAGR